MSTSALRGSDTESLINATNKYYGVMGIARVDKIPTPIKVTAISNKGKITNGFFEEKGLIDYIGICQGFGISFDSKETNLNNLPLSNIHYHQLVYIDEFIKQGGLSFLIVYFKKYNKYYLVPGEIVLDYYNKSLNGGRKSIPYEEMNDKYEIKITKKGILDYLHPLNIYYQEKEAGIFREKKLLNS